MPTPAASPAAATGGRAPTLALRGLSIRFGGTQALDGADLVIERGEVHGLLGENGSGKSTLIKILAGYHAPDAGELEFNGAPVKMPVRAEALRSLGIAFVHQDLALVPSISVGENLVAGELASRSRWMLPARRIHAHAASVFARYDVALDPRRPVAALSPVDRAMLGIVRALEDLRVARAGEEEAGCLLVLDEPTVFLPREGIARLFAFVREHVRRGASVLFVSHDLDEVREITDRVTVLRDGRVAGEGVTSELGRRDLIEMIVGQSLAEDRPPAAPPSRERTAVAIDGLSGGALTDFSVDVGPGEIVGLAGMPGSGFNDVPYVLFGARAGDGSLTFGDERVRVAGLTPHRACGHGIALIPADRKTAGGVGDLTVADNISATVLGDYQRGPLLNVRKAARDAGELCDRLDVRPSDPTLSFGSLSGGNQQKVLLGKWLRTQPRLLLLDEPTQGVDVGARDQIWTLLRTTARESGQAVLCSSTDHEQLATLCDRVLVVAGGRVVAELTASGLTKEDITRACLSAAPTLATIEGDGI